MSLLYLQRLINELEKTEVFPPARELYYRQGIEVFSAIRESDAAKLKPTWWDTEYENNTGYVIDPLGERIPGVWADMLFGEEPEFEPGIKGDKQQLEDLVDNNDLPEALPWAEELRSSEGEVWNRLVVTPELESVQIEWHSRLNVIPLFIGRKIVAGAIFSVLETDKDTKKSIVYIEYHTEGTVINRLYEHMEGGGLKPLDMSTRLETENLRPEWNHGLPMLLDRIPNKLGRDWRCGTSDLKGVAGLLLALNEATNIGQENARLTAKQRAVIPERYLDLKGRLPKGAEILVATGVDQDPDKIKNDFALIEWEFDADAIIKYKADLCDIILTRARVAPQLVGRHTETAQTGPALRARLVDTILAANRKGKGWDDKLPERLVLAARLESLSVRQGGLGKPWTNPDKEPVFKRRNPLPEDEESRSRRVVTEVNAKVKAKKTAISELNPTWGPDRIDDEMSLLAEEADEAMERAQEQAETKRLSDGRDVPDPASKTSRSPGQRKQTTAPDPGRIVRT